MSESVIVNPETFELRDGYAPKRVTTETVVTVRRMTREEILMLHGRRVSFIGLDGACRELRVTSIKTWKTKPDVEIGVKYGLKEYGRFDMAEALQRFVVVIGRETRKK